MAAPNDVLVDSIGTTTIHTLPASQPAGTTDTVALPVQGVTGGVAISVAAAALPLPAGAATAASQPSLNGDGGALAHVTNFPGTQPVSGAITANAGTGTFAVSAASLPLPTGAMPASGGSVAVSGTAAISAASLPLPAGAAQDGTDGTGITPPSGAAGIRGWLSGIFNKLNTSIGVTGTFWQATQPISGTVTANAGSGTLAVSAASLPLPTGAMGSTGGTVGLVAGAALVGKVGIDQTTPGTTNAVSVTNFPGTQPVSGTFWQTTQPVSGTVTANAGTGTLAVSAASLPLPTGAATATGVASVVTALGTPIQATGGTVQAVAGTAGGATPAHYLSAASTNATSVKASAGTLYNVMAINTTATLYYLKLYDKAIAPTVGTDTPVLSLPIPASATGAGVVMPASVGVSFVNGIAFALTGGISDTDTTNAATGVAINLVYK